MQLAADTGLRVDELQLDRAVQRIAEGNNVTLAEFRRQLEADGVPFEKFRAEVRQQILLQRLREREVDDRVQVSESEIDIFLEENKAAAAGVQEYNVAHVLVRIPEQASPERIAQARARAEKARAEALAGGDFARIAASASDAGDALQGGALGWRSLSRMPELFADVAEDHAGRGGERRAAQPRGVSRGQAARAPRRGQRRPGDADARAPHPDQDQRSGLGGRRAPAPRGAARAHRGRHRFRRAGAAQFRRTAPRRAAASWAGSTPGTRCPSSSGR